MVECRVGREHRGGRFASGVACAGAMGKHPRLYLPLPLGAYQADPTVVDSTRCQARACKTALVYQKGSNAIIAGGSLGGTGVVRRVEIGQPSVSEIGGLTDENTRPYPRSAG
jgi:hypothetical protein